MRLLRLAALAAFALTAHAQTATVTVSDTIKDATGANFSGTVQISSVTFSVSGLSVGPTSTTITVTGGTFSQALYPGTYTIIYRGTRKNETRTWTVAASPSEQHIHDIESTATATPVGRFNFALIQGLTAGDFLYGGATGLATRLAKPADGTYSVQFASGVPSWAAGGGGTWGSITGTLSSQTDLQSALDGKSATGHNHNASYAAISHASTHATGQADAIAPGDIGAEPALGNPDVDGKVLSSTAAGVRSWVAQSAGGGGNANLNIDAPSTVDTNKYHLTWPTAVTIQRISCSTDTGTVSINFDTRDLATPNTAGTDVLGSALVCDNDTQTTTTFSSAGVADYTAACTGCVLNLQVTATASSPNVVRIHVEAQ